ncbi:MAG: glycoside hydrolase family 108 protein [Sphingomonadaceae bacterium]
MSDETPSSQNPEITVEGYTPRYRAAVRHLLVTEGGSRFVNDPADRGGATKYGISLRFLAAEGAFDEDGDGRRDFDLDLDGDIDGQDVRQLTAGDAIFLYHRCFWQRLQAESFPRPLGEMLFDQAVNGGLTTAGKLLQRAINDCLMRAKAPRKPALLIVDGQIGRITRAAFAWVLRYPAQGMPALIAAYREAARERYRAIVRRYPVQKRFLRGWLARADQLGRTAMESVGAL